MRVVLVDFGERHRHKDERAALHCSRPPADQSGKRVASWTGKSPDTSDADILARMSRGCYAENGPVEFKLRPNDTPAVCVYTRDISPKVRYQENCPRARIEVRPTALPRLHALESAAAAVLGRATPHASPR